jgi:hypothetical protein
MADCSYKMNPLFFVETLVMLDVIHLIYYIFCRLKKKMDRIGKKMVKNAFAKNIKNRIFPKKDLIMKFIKEHADIFGEDDYVRIRTLIVNEYNTK